MSESVLIKHGWELVFVGKSFSAYQLEDMLYVKWDNGGDALYEI